MSHSDVHLHLDAYLGVRQALGFQMRAERTLLRAAMGREARAFSQAHAPSWATLCATSRRTRTRAPSVPTLPWIGPVPRPPSGGQVGPPNA